MGGYGQPLLFLLLALHLMTVPSIMADCPLDLSASNFTLAASICSSKDERGKCCRYINAFVALSIARFANATSSLGVPSNISGICLSSIAQTMELYGVTQNATVFCGFGTKIPVNYECKGRTSVTQMLLSPKFVDVSENCKVPLSAESKCKKCVNAGISYLHHLLVAAEDNVTFSTCRDATFAALASQVDDGSAADIASCFFGVEGLIIPPVLEPPHLSSAPETAPTPLIAASPNQLISGVSRNEGHHHYHLTLIPGVGITVAIVALIMLVVLIILIRQKSKELEDLGNLDGISSKGFHPSHQTRKFQGGPSMFRKFRYKEIKKATDNFNTIIGLGGFGTVYKGQFADGLVAAVKRMNKVSEQDEDEFCREIELVARLHHRHLVSLRGFCIEKHERFLLYEYMSNGSLKDHLHSPGATPLSWQTRIRIAIDVANALEYLHFYCDPPLCHRDIKSSNILLDENLVAKVADFGLTHASKDVSVCFEPVNTDIRGTPGFIDPEYVVTQQLAEKSDVYSYGVVLLEIVTGRRAIQDSKNLVEWSQTFMEPESDLHELVDPLIRDSVDLEQLQTVTTIAAWCTQKEGQARPSIKEVLRLLYESSDVMHSGFVQAMEDEEEYGGSEGRGRASKGKMLRSESVFHSGDGRYLASSSSTSRSHCSRSFLLETGSPQSPPNIPSI